ncbi:F-box protein CPR1-like [Rosa sericea]
MAETEELSEDIIVNILIWLPVKSLIRFTSVSKRLHSIILSDPKFAQSQLKAARQQKTLSRRLLVSTETLPIESLHLGDTPSFGEPSSVRKLSFPFQPQPGGSVKLLGSCSGLVFVAVDNKSLYIWNPSIGFLKQLPDPGFPLDDNVLPYYGVGYLSATDDYKVLVASCDFWSGEIEVKMFSSRTHIWQRIESPCRSDFRLFRGRGQGTLSNDAFHWLNYRDDDEEEEHEIVSFDLEEEVFRRMPLPNFEHDGKTFCKLGVCGGCLCVSRYPDGAFDSIDFWVMREYGVTASWIMLFSLKPPELPLYSREFLVLESCTVAVDWTGEGHELIRIDHKEDEKQLGRYMVKGVRISMVEYEDSLLWISGYHSGKRDREQVKILETHQKASGS